MPATYYTGDVPANVIMYSGGDAILRLPDDSAFAARSVDTRQFVVNMPSPTNGASVIMGRIDQSWTMFSVDAIIDSGTNVVFNVAEHASLSTGGTDIMGSDMTVTTSGNGVGIGSGGYVTGNAYWLVLEITTVSGTVGNIIVIVTGLVT